MMKIKKKLSGQFSRLLFSLILIFPARAFGQDDPDQSAQLAPIEVTSTRLPAPVEEATDSITVINTREIRADSAPFLAEQLRMVPGVEVQVMGSVGEQTSVRIRGSENNQSLILFDGVRLNSPYTRAADLGDFLVAGLDRIEIVRGAFSSLYGSDAIGGVINLIPSPGRSLEPGIRKEKGISAGAEGGSFATFKERVEFTAAGEESAFSLAWARVDSGGRNDRDGFAGNLAAGKFRVLIPGGVEAGISALFSQSEKELYLDAPYSLYNPDYPILAQVKDSNYSEARETLLTVASLRKSIFLSGELLIHGSVLSGEDDLMNPADPGWTDYHASWTNSTRRGAGIQMYLIPVQMNSVLMNSVLLGTEYSEEDALQTMETNLPVGGVGDPILMKIDGKRIERTFFLEDRLKLLGLFYLNAGLLMDFSSDRPDASEPFLSPRGSMAFKLDKSGTKIRGGLGRGYRNPSIDERFFPIKGNPKLKPEEAWSYEVGLEQEFKRYGIKLDVTGFLIRYTNLIGYDPDPNVFELQNSDRAKSEGLEAGLAYQPGRRLQFKFNYTFNRTRKRILEINEQTGLPEEKWISFFWRPENSFSCVLNVHPMEKLLIGLNWEFRGGYDEAGDIINPEGELLSGNNPGFNLIGFLSEYTIPYQPKPLESLSVFLRGENILNKKYSEVKGYPMPGISFYGGVNLKI